MIYPRHITLLSLKCPDHLPNSAVDDDPVHSPTNNERAQWVFTALQHFAGSTRQDIGEELDDVLCDFPGCGACKEATGAVCTDCKPLKDSRVTTEFKLPGRHTT